MPEGLSGSKKWSYHFGLYRQTAQHAKEDFLRLSRARQMRRGWTCAAVSSLIVISAIVVILIIYDYAIVVESSMVQKRECNKTDKNPVDEFQQHEAPTNINRKTHENFNRRSLDFNIEALKKLPHLVNALEENNITYSPISSSDSDFYHKETNLDSDELNINDTVQSLPRRWTPMRRTSPRPLYYEPRESTPAPFHKPPAITHPSWLDNYRNTQRLKNLEKVIDYLKMNHARMKDHHGAASNIHNVAFSGVYIHPRKKENVNTITPINIGINDDGTSQNYSSRGNTMVNGHAYQSDILRTYKPDNPADINLLAEKKIKLTSHIKIPPSKNTNYKSYFKTPTLGGIRYPFYDCRGENCFSNDERKINFRPEEKQVLETASKFFSNSQDSMRDKSNFLSVMLDIYPMEEKSEELLKRPESFVEAMTSTKAPFVHFRPRLNFQEHYARPKNNRPLKTPLLVPSPSPPFIYDSMNTQTNNLRYMNRKRFLPNKGGEGTIKYKPTQMLVHLNLYPKKRPVSDEFKRDDVLQSTLKPSLSTSKIMKKEPTTNVEIIKSNSFEISVNETTTNPPFKTVPQDTHFPTVLENARRINELQLLKPEYIPFELGDAKKPEGYFDLRTTLNIQPTSSTNDSIQVKVINDNMNCSNKVETNSPGRSEVERSTNATQATVQINNGHYRYMNTYSPKVMFATEDDRNTSRNDKFKSFNYPTSKPYHTIKRKPTISIDEGNSFFDFKK